MWPLPGLLKKRLRIRTVPNSRDTSRVRTIDYLTLKAASVQSYIISIALEPPALACKLILKYMKSKIVQ